MQTEITQNGPLLDPHGHLAQVGWCRQPRLDCNLEAARFYALRPLQFMRLKRWDYYAIFSPRRFFSATIADLGYAANIFVYTLDFNTNDLHEEGLVIPFSLGVTLPRNSQMGESVYAGKGVELRFYSLPDRRQVYVSWPRFDHGRGIEARLSLHCPPEHESMTIVIPIGDKRFYYNRKINCMPASGVLQYGDEQEMLQPGETLGSLDWGRGVWEYRSFWNWASASGFLPEGRRVGLNLGSGFGDTSRATEDCFVLDDCLHKLEAVRFEYDAQDYMKPWKFSDAQGRLSLEFVPFKERLARTNLGIITSEVHQMFGRYRGFVIADSGEKIEIEDLVGFAEEHQARW
jgi:Domain of unknown function (DUF2804), N-terminal/Domain of unknown function (DUF2804), C-terminal